MKQEQVALEKHLKILTEKIVRKGIVTPEDVKSVM